MMPTTLPTLTPRTPTETPFAYGARAFQWLLAESLNPRGGRVWNLDTDTLDAMVAASSVFLVSSMPSALLTRAHDLRLTALTTVARRRAEAAQAVVNPTPAPARTVPPPPEGGRSVRRAIPPPVRPTPTASVRPF